MKIYKPKIFQENNLVKCEFKIITRKGIQKLWYSLSKKYSNYISGSCDAALVALLIPAMKNSENIIIHGEISEKLLFNLSNSLQILLKHIIPNLNVISITADEVVGFNKNITSSGIATGFSGGIDSYCVLYDNYFHNIYESYKISHLLFNNVGSHGRGGEKLFKKKLERLLPISEHIGLPLISINSNLHYFFGDDIGFQKTHTLRNISVALLLQNGFGKYMYASTYDYTKIFVGKTYDIAYCDSIILPLLSTELINVFSVGSEYTRVEKTLKVAKSSISYKTLDVCVKPEYNNIYINCSECWKCLRTLCTLDIAKLLFLYEEVFDLTKYKKKRINFFAKILSSNDPFLKEIYQFARNTNFSFPMFPFIIFISNIYKIKSLFIKLLNKIIFLLIKLKKIYKTRSTY